MSLFGTYFYKTIFIFVKQNLWVPPIFFFFILYNDFSFVLENNIYIYIFFFRGSHALFQKGYKMFSLFIYFYLILLYTHKINIIIFFFNILQININYYFSLSLSLYCRITIENKIS